MGCLEFYLGRLKPATARTTRFCVEGWIRWVGEYGGRFAGYSADDLVEYQRAHGGFEVLDLLQAYVKGFEGRGKRAGYVRRVYSACVNLFAHNRVPLPSDPMFRIRGDRPPVKGALRVEHVRRVVEASNPMYRAFFLCVFQAGMGLGEAEEWNLTGLGDLRRQLEKGAHPIRVNLSGRKHNENLKPFYTFIGRDAIEALKVYLEARSRGDAIFLTRYNTPLTITTARKYWIDKLQRLGVIPRTPEAETGRGAARYGMNAHEIRDVFRSRWRPSGADVEVAEFMMGHDIDRYGYDKSPWQYPEWFEEQYLKAEPWLNILSQDPERVPARDFNRLQEELAETRKAIKEAEWLLSDPEVSKILRTMVEERKGRE